MDSQAIYLLALLLAQPQDQRDSVPAPQQVVVSGTQTDVDATRNAVAGKIVIGKKNIAESGVQNVGELLRREPAISVGKDGRLGLLGLPGYTQVLVDGLPPQGDAFSIDLVHIERIEIIKSATAAIGPIGIAGSINIIRRKSERKDFTQISAGARSNGGQPGASFSWANNHVAADSPFLYNLTVSASKVKTPDVTQYFQTRGIEGSRAALEHEGESSTVNVFESVLANGELTWTLTPAHRITLAPDIGHITTPSHANERRRWVDGQTLSIVRHAGQTMNVLSLPIRWNWQVGDDSTFMLQLKINRLRFDGDSKQVEESSNEAAHLRKNRRLQEGKNYFVDLDFNTTLDSGHEITTGLKLVRNRLGTLHEDTVNDEPDTSLAALGRASARQMESARLFVQDEWRLDKSLALNAGLSVERRMYSFDEGPAHHQAEFNMWSPSVHLSKRIGGNKKRQFRISLARSFQPPETDEMLLHPTINQFAQCLPDRLCGPNAIDTADQAGNPGLRPERALGLNLSYTHGIGANSEILVEWYMRDILNKTGLEYSLENVLWANSPRYVIRPVNFGEAKIRGTNLEGRIAGKDFSSKLSALEVYGSLGIARSELSDLPGPDNHIADQLPWRGKLGGTYTTKDKTLKFGADISILPSTWVRNNTSQRIYQSSRTTLSVNGSWKINSKSRLTVNLDNLLPRKRSRIDEYESVPTLLHVSTQNKDYTRISMKFDASL
jgi:outer membrane receptor protein involved in Fe transport